MNTSTQTPARDLKVQVIEEVYAAFGRRDLDSIVGMLADDVDWASEATTTSAPWYGAYSKDEVPLFFKALGSSLEVSEFTPLSMTANDTDVMVALHWTVTAHRTGRTLSANLNHWWRLAADKIVAYRGLDDSEQAAALFDAPAPTTTGTWRRFPSGTASGERVDDDPKVAAVRRLYAAVGSGDLDAILAELAEDIDWATTGQSASVPWFGDYRGRGDIPRFFQAIGESIEITEFTPLAYTINDTDVMVPVHWSYTAKPTGKRAEMTMQHWWRFNDNGTISYFRGGEDTEQSAAAFS